MCEHKRCDPDLPSTPHTHTDGTVTDTCRDRQPEVPVTPGPGNPLRTGTARHPPTSHVHSHRREDGLRGEGLDGEGTKRRMTRGGSETIGGGTDHTSIGEGGVSVSSGVWGVPSRRDPRPDTRE